MSCTPGIPSEPRLPPDYLESSPNTNDNENKILDPHDTALNKRGSQLLLYCWSSAIWKIEEEAALSRPAITASTCQYILV